MDAVTSHVLLWAVQNHLLGPSFHNPFIDFNTHSLNSYVGIFVVFIILWLYSLDNSTN